MNAGPDSSVLIRNRWGAWENWALAAYLLVVGTGVAFHESWADEAQAWLLARDSGWWQMMLHLVRYEGTPGLWHSLLWLLARLGVSFAGMHWITAAFAAGGVAVLLRFAPFPRILRLLLPFTFFLAYQDAVIARSYVLFTVLAFGAAALLRARARRPLLLALLLGLMANLSVHCFLASLGLAAVAFAQLPPFHRARYALRLALPLGLCWAIAVATALPPPDVAFPAGKNIAESWKKLVAAAEHKPYQAPAEVEPAGELSPVLPPVHHRTSAQNLQRRVVRLLALMTFPLSSSRLLGLAAAVLVLAHGFARGGRVALVPYLLLLVAFVPLYIAPRHTGVLFVTFLVTAWLSWPRQEDTRWARSLVFVLLLITAEQLGWTAQALMADVGGAYSGGRMTAEFLREHAVGKRVAGFYYHDVAVLPDPAPGLPTVFANQRTAYWDWSRANRTDPQAPLAWRAHPDYVIVGGFEWGDQAEITADWSAWAEERGAMPELGDDYRILPWYKAHGYRETHRFCGHAWMRMGYSELLCDVVLQPQP